MRKKILLMTFLVAIIGFCGTGLTAQNNNVANVAKVGNTEYATIDEAIAKWTNNTTLTLLADVTLSDVIKLSSTEYHILDLGTYTMTAASGKDAIQYVVNGRSSASYALDIKADAVNPGGITATGGSVVRHTKPMTNAPSKDRPITRFYGGVFNASYVVRQGGTFGAGYTGASAPHFYFYDGEYNGTIYTNRSIVQFHGGVFNGSIQMSVDSSSYGLVAGGTFKNLSNSMGSALNSDKFTIGSAKGVYDREVYIDDSGNYVIAATEPQGIEADVAKTPGTNDYLAYSKVATEGQLGYTDVYTALEKNTSAKVTVYVEELDLKDSKFKGTIVVPEGNDITITNAPAGITVKRDKGEGNFEIIEPSEDGTITTIVPKEVATYDELVAALVNGGVIKLTADITVDTKITAVDGTVIDLNDNTLYVNVENSYYDNVIIKNGNIVLGKDDVHVCDGYFLVNAGKTLELNGVNVSSSAEGIKGYAVFHLKTGANLDLINSTLNIADNEHTAGYIVYAGEATATVDVVGTTITGSKVNGIVHATTVIDESTVTLTNVIEHGINRSGVTIDDSNVTISGGTGRGITAQHGPLNITGNSVVSISEMGAATIELRNNQNLTVAETATVTVDAAVNNTTSGTITGNITVNESLGKVAKIGDTYYKTLQEAFKAATSGCTIEILSNVTIDEAWDNRYTGTKFTVPVTINGNDNKLTFNDTVSDGGNYHSVFRFQADATVKNLTIDLTNATANYNRVRAISSSANLVVEECSFIGSINVNNARAIIFGEGAGANVGNLAISITNSEFINWRRGITDNENAQDVKTVTITGNTLTDAGVDVSAKETVTFTGNTVSGAYVNIRSYSDENNLSVIATGNTLEENTENNYNYIYAKNIEAQEEFVTKNPPLKVSTKAELNAAINAANDGDVIEMTADIDYGTDQLAIAKAITLDLGGKTLTTRNAYGGMSIKNNPTIKNGNIVHASNTAAIKVWNATAFEDLVIDVQGKGDANKTIGGIVLQSGSTTRVGSIKNVTIEGDALTNGIETYNCGDATENVIGSMENVNIDAVGTAMLISAPCGTATNCTFDGGVNGIEIWIKGNYSASLGLVDCDVVGGVFAHDEFSSNPEIVNNGTLNLTADVDTEGAGVDDVTLTLARIEAEKVGGVLVDVMEQAKAKVNNTYYQTLQAAVNAATEGDEIDLLKDVKLTSTLLLTKNNILDGNGFKLTPAEGGFTPDGNAAIVLAANMSGYEANRTYTVKNLTIEGFSTPSRIVRANFCDATIQNCIFDDNASASIITSAYAVLNVEDNTFTNNTASFAVINVGSDVSDGTNLVAKIIDNTFENNEAAIAGIFLASSADVTDNHFKGNTHTGDNANAAAILAGPYTGNMAYTVNIKSNAFENAMSKGVTTLPSVFAEDWSSLGSTTSFDLSLNYWDGNEPVAGTAYKTSGDNPQVTVKSYYKTYTDGTLGGLVEYPQGNDFTGYTRGDAIWGEVWGNARESFVIKVLDANGNVMGTTSLNNVNGIIDGDVNVTWSLKFDAASNTDEYWTMSWTTAPTIDNMPAKVELWVDGVKVSGGNVVLNGPDNINKIYAAVTDNTGKILAYHTNVQEAIKAAAAVTSVARTATAGTVEVLSDVTVDKWIMFAEKMSIGDGSLITLNINGVTIDGNGKTLTIKSIESAGNGGYLFYDAQNLTVKDLTINIADGLVGGIGLQSGTISNVTFNGGQYGVLPGKNGVTVSGCTFNDTKGYAVYYEDARPDIVVTGNTFNTADGKYAITMRSNEQFTNNTITKGRVNLANSAASTVSGNDFGTERFKVYNGATATISNNKINNLVFNETDVPTESTFTDNTLSPEAQAAIDALPAIAGEGTEANPYLIDNVDDLVWLQEKVDELAQDGSTQFAGKYFKLTNDIDLSGINWNPIGTMNGDHGSFKGVFDGGDHTISNLHVEQAGNGIGLFARTAGNAVIKNLKLNNVTVKSTNNSNYVGGLVGNAYASTKIENVHVSGNVCISGRGYIGGIAGHGYVVMDNVSVVATGDGHGNDKGLITSTFWCAGGVLGYAGEGATNIMNAHVENVVVTSAAGGLGAIVGMAEDNNGTQPISGSNLSAENVEIKTYTGAYGDSYANYALGYLYGGNPTSILTGDLSVDNVIIETSNGVAPEVNDAVAQIGNSIYFNLQDALNAAVENETITLLRDIKIAKRTEINNRTLTIDGNGKTIRQDENFDNTIAMFDINGGKVTINNVIFDGVKKGAVVRTVGTEFAMDNVTAQNSVHTVGQGLFRLVGQNTITNSKFLNNNCSMVITLNYDGESNTPQLVKNCLFEGNECNSVAALYYVKGAGCTIKDSEFVENTVNCNNNGATVYLGFTENNVVTGNIFDSNNVIDASTSARVAGAIFFGYEAEIENNVFVGNTASNANNDVLGQICTSTYYDCTIDLSGNYWGGEAPEYGKDYTIQHTAAEHQGVFQLDNYYKTFTTDENGNVELGDKVNIDYVAQVGKFSYETLAEAFTVAQENETITLLIDTELSEMITIPNGKTVVLDLNGKIITGTDKGTASFGLITNKGNLTITDSSEEAAGKITLEAEQNRGWNAYSSVISNTVGGKLTVESGTLEHLGGTDMAYGIDNLTNGKGTYAETVINGGTIKSTYRAIRQFLNGVEAQNILTVNGGTIEGTNKSIWMQDPSANANTGTLTVGEEANLIGNVYLYVTPNSTSWPVEVSIAAGALAEGSEVMTANVPAGYELELSDGIYGVTYAVATIDNNRYETLQEAINAAGTAETTINVIANTTENITIQEGANITLEFDEDITLNGYFAPFEGNLTINGGTINNTNSGASAIEINAGELNLNNVNIASARHAVRIDGAVTATINGGKYTLTATSGTRHAVNVSGGAEVTIKAGTFVGPKGTTMDSGAAVNVQTGATVTIEGGDFSGGKNHTLSADGNLIVTGGTFDQDPSAYLAQGYITKYNETTSRYEVFKGVAKIENEYFASIQDAIDAAENNDVITVISDFEMDITSGVTNSSGHYVLTNVANKAVVIDLNGKKVTVDVTNLPEGCKDNMLMSVFCADTDGNLTLKDSSNGNGSVSVTGGESKTVYSLVIAYGGLVNIEGGNYSVDYMPAGRGMIYGNVSDHSGADGSNVSKGANISGGNFTLGNVGTLANGSPWILATAGSNTGKYIFVTGGTYNADILHQHWIFEVVAPTNKALKNNGNGTYTIVDAVAFVKHHEYDGYYSEIGYATLEEAFEIAETGDVVTLVTNVELENTITVNAGKEVILDLNGKTISGVCNSGQGHMFMVQNTADLTVKDSSENEEGKITYSRGTSNTGWVIDLEGDLILESGTIELTGDSWSIGYVVDVRPNSWGSEYTEATTFTMSGGKLVSSDAAVRVASSSADNHENVSANFIMNGGEIEAAWDGIFVQQSNAAYDILNVRINGGNIKSAYSPLRLYGPAATSVLNNVENPITLNITGGTFDYTGDDLENNKWLVPGVIMVSGGATFEQMLEYTDFEITGGTFEGDVNAYCAEGFAATNNDNGTWTVMPAQEQHLVAGWNWYSTYIDINGAQGLTKIENALGTDGIEILSHLDGWRLYEDDEWYGELAGTDVKKMYKIEVGEGGVDMRIAGNIVDFTNETIEIKNGFNWISYPFNQPMNLNDALSGFTPAEGDFIISHFNFAFYYDNQWEGSLESFTPGEGYIYERIGADTELSYNVSNTRGAVKANVTTDGNKWMPNGRLYPNNMTMIAVVDGLANANYEVAAFVNGELRGSARPIYIESLDAYMLFLTIHGGDEVEEMSFRLYDIDNDTEYDLSDRINYSNNAHLGSVNEPYVFSRGTTGIGEASMSEVNIYPNPTTTGTEINLEATCDKVEVFNALGVKVAEYQNVDTIDALETAGIYVIRITNNGNVQNCRLVVK